MTKKITINSCEECPYAYYDRYNYLDSPSDYYCDLGERDILDIKILPDWCKLENA